MTNKPLNLAIPCLYEGTRVTVGDRTLAECLRDDWKCESDFQSGFGSNKVCLRYLSANQRQYIPKSTRNPDSKPSGYELSPDDEFGRKE